MNGFPHDSKARGVYVGAVGGLPLFSSDTKFDSGALEDALATLQFPFFFQYQGGLAWCREECWQDSLQVLVLPDQARHSLADDVCACASIDVQAVV